MPSVGAVRLELKLSSHSEWIKLFDPRDWTVFVPKFSPTPEAIEQGSTVRIELDVGGWKVMLAGGIVGQREDPSGVAGVIVALSTSERDKINYLNGFVRGGLLNLREKRRLPIKLAVTYGAIEGPAHTHTKDINEEGLFLLTDKPLPETSQVHMLISVPGHADRLSIVGKVSHTILDGDSAAPGMGIVFELGDDARDKLRAIIDELETQLAAGSLPTSLE
jgi:Tfp pilus assembly protein PilZ